jgi:hypothetical protein
MNIEYVSLRILTLRGFAPTPFTIATGKSPIVEQGQAAPLQIMAVARPRFGLASPTAPASVNGLEISGNADETIAAARAVSLSNERRSQELAGNSATRGRNRLRGAETRESRPRFSGVGCVRP